MSDHAFGTATAQTSGTANPFTHAATIADDDTVLVALVVVASATLRTGGALSVGGRTMQQAGSTQQRSVSPETSVELWYLENPPPGVGSISVPNDGGLTIRVVAATGRSSTGASEFHAADGNSGTSTNPNASITTTKDGCIVFGVIGEGATTWAPSGRTGTQIWDVDNGANGSGGQYVLQATAGAQAVNWTFGTSDDWAIACAAFAPARGRVALNNFQAVSAGDGMAVAEKIR